MSFNEIVKALMSGLSEFSFGDAVDILLIAVLVYKLIEWTKETRAYQVLKGAGLLLLVYFACQVFALTTLSYLLGLVVQSGIVVIVILFQPEIRRAFEHLGRGKIFDKAAFMSLEKESTDIVRELQKALLNLARRRVGALIVIEQDVALGDIISTGTRVDGTITSALIENIFEPNTPLHDGAVVIRNGIIAAAACFLPLSDDMDISRELGTRHRAALGISSVSDSVTLVVSEETGVISYARDGRLVRYVDAKALKDLLDSIFIKEHEGSLKRLLRRTKHGKQQQGQ
ncbi:diadenylate cyclase CdaA [Christensenellaceae bacterium OttesenSCG-928-M15]|nr:diadenylate cyclase CdaA [Christensenellaceae bacterium OttesenSCG-928-M15]